jgi:hypothetical protein
MTVAGVPTYGLLDWVTDTALPWVGEKVTGLIGGRYGGDEGLKNLVNRCYVRMGRLKS